MRPVACRTAPEKADEYDAERHSLEGTIIAHYLEQPVAVAVPHVAGPQLDALQQKDPVVLEAIAHVLGEAVLDDKQAPVPVYSAWVERQLVEEECEYLLTVLLVEQGLRLRESPTVVERHSPEAARRALFCSFGNHSANSNFKIILVVPQVQ